MSRVRRNGVREAALGAVVVAVLLAADAQAKPWSKWAPNPLASDSAFAAMSAQSTESLSAAEISWLEVQRDWRAQRREESRSTASITEPFNAHHVRRSDAHFAELASRPYAALADSERTWLIAESAAQHADHVQVTPARSSHTAGLMLLSLIVGALGAATALNHPPMYP